MGAPEDRTDAFKEAFRTLSESRWNACYERLRCLDPRESEEMTSLILTALNLDSQAPAGEVEEAVDFILVLIGILTDPMCPALKRDCASKALEFLYVHIKEEATKLNEAELQHYLEEPNDPSLNRRKAATLESQCATLDIVQYSWAIAHLDAGYALAKVYNKSPRLIDRSKRGSGSLPLGSSHAVVSHEVQVLEMAQSRKWTEKAIADLEQLDIERDDALMSLRKTHAVYKEILDAYEPIIRSYQELKKGCSISAIEEPVLLTVPPRLNHSLKERTKNMFQAKERGLAKIKEILADPQNRSRSTSPPSSPQPPTSEPPTTAKQVFPRRMGDHQDSVSLIRATGAEGNASTLQKDLLQQVLEYEKKKIDVANSLRARFGWEEAGDPLTLSRSVYHGSLSADRLLDHSTPPGTSAELETEEAPEVEIELSGPPPNDNSTDDSGRHSSNSNRSHDECPGSMYVASGARGDLDGDPIDDGMNDDEGGKNGGDGGITRGNKKVKPKTGEKGEEAEKQEKAREEEGKEEGEEEKAWKEVLESQLVRDEEEKLEKEGQSEGEEQNPKDKESSNTQGDLGGDCAAAEELRPNLHSPRIAYQVPGSVEMQTSRILRLFRGMRIEPPQTQRVSRFPLGVSRNRLPKIKRDIPLINGEIPDLPSLGRHLKKKPLRILDKRLGEGDPYGCLTDKHYIYRLVEWARDTLCVPQNAAKFAIVLRKARGHFDPSKGSDNLENEDPPTAKEITGVVAQLSNKFPEVQIDVLPGNLIGLHQRSRPGIIKLHSELFYSVENGIRLGTGIAHIVWLIFQTIAYELAHYLETNITGVLPGSVGNSCLNDEEGDIGDLVKLLLFGAISSWDCRKPDLNEPVLMHSWGAYWWDKNYTKRYAMVDSARAIYFIKSTPEIIRLTSEEWVKLSKDPIPEQWPTEEDLRDPGPKFPECRQHHQVIPRAQDLFDVDKLYARRELIDEKDRQMLRMMRDSKKSVGWEDIERKKPSSPLLLEPQKTVLNVAPMPQGYPEVLHWSHIVKFVVPMNVLLAGILFALDPPQMDQDNWPSALTVVLCFLAALAYAAPCFVPLRRMMLLVRPFLTEEELDDLGR